MESNVCKIENGTADLAAILKGDEIKAFINGFAKYLKTHPKKEINYAEDLRTEKSA